jgi:uncharacterized protein YegL
MGGTCISEPLSKALEMNPSNEFINKGGYKKMIFLLTDGEAIDRDECLKAAEHQNKGGAIIHSFGIGNDCDQKFCQ